MFYIHKMQQRVLVEPRLLGSNLRETVKKNLLAMMEGRCSSDYGYLISVLRVTSLSTLSVEPLEGCASFIVDFDALTLLPSKDEVADALVKEVNALGVFAFIGPLSIFVSTHQIPGHFSEAEGHRVIVLNDGGNPIARGSFVRVKILGVKIEHSNVYAVGTLNEDCLGPAL
jgi:DNA-directed RNA polymerase II subunit RPB7